MESELEAQERLFRQQQQQHVPNPPMPVKEVPKPKNKRVKKKVQTGKEPPSKPVIKKTHHKQTGFRFQSTTGFLTFPQVENPLGPKEQMEKFLEFMKGKKHNVVQAICALETHKKDEKEENQEDCGTHWHIIFKTSKKVDTTDPRYFDPIVGKHGDYKACRRFQQSVLYATKEGNYDVLNLDVNAIRKAIESKTGVTHSIVANKILEKPRTLLEMQKKYPGYVIQHQDKVSKFIKLAETGRTEERESFHGVSVPWPVVGQEWKTKLSAWINKNFQEERVHKQKQLYLYGPPNVGKTTLINELAKYFKPYQIPTDSSYYGGFDNSIQFAFIDEWAGQKELHFMNSFLEGTRMSLNIKYDDPFVKTKNIPVIICSNIPPEQSYHKLWENETTKVRVQAFLERLEIIEAKEDIRVEFFQKPLNELRQEVGLEREPRMDQGIINLVNNEDSEDPQEEDEEEDSEDPEEQLLQAQNALKIAQDKLKQKVAEGTSRPLKKRKKFLEDDETDLK